MLGRASRVVVDAAASLLRFAPSEAVVASASAGSAGVGAAGKGPMYVMSEKQAEFARLSALLSSGARGGISSAGEGAAMATAGAEACHDHGVEPLALDTEFTSFPSYRPALELVQVAGLGWDGDGGAACIDCASLRPEALVSLLSPAASTRELVVHDGRVDLRLLRDIGLVPKRVFDTQLAAGFTRCGGRIGLGDLVHQLLGIEMDKREATSDWRVRPLSAEQLSYAANDVMHMLHLREILLDEMQQADRRDWFDDEMQSLLAETAAPDPADEERWRSVKRARKLRDSPSGLAVLRGLAAWREATARSVNVAPSLILSDDAIVQLAVAQPRALPELHTMRSIKGTTVRYYGRALLRTIDESLSSVEGEDHDLEPPSEWLHNDPSLPGSVDAATAATAARHRLLATLYERSYDLKVSHDLLATSDDLAAFLEASEEEESNTKVMQGWRREAVGTQLIEAKRNSVRRL